MFGWHRLLIVGKTWLTHKIGSRSSRSTHQQKYEADFRFNLVRFRENSEGVALYHGEEDNCRLPFPFRVGGEQLVRS